MSPQPPKPYCHNYIDLEQEITKIRLKWMTHGDGADANYIIDFEITYKNGRKQTNKDPGSAHGDWTTTVIPPGCRIVGLYGRERSNWSIHRLGFICVRKKSFDPPKPLKTVFMLELKKLTVAGDVCDSTHDYEWPKYTTDLEGDLNQLKMAKVIHTTSRDTHVHAIFRIGLTNG